MKMLRRLPKILRFIPGTAQDVRAYFLTLQYWLAGSDENVVAMVRTLIDRYASGDRLTRRGMMATDAPVEYPELGVYHPRTKQRISESLRLLPRKKGEQGTVGLLLLRSYLLGRDTGHYDAAIKAFEAAGLKVVPVFASGLDARPAIEKFFIDRDSNPTVDAIVNLTGFSLVGGPAYNDAEGAIETLTGLNLPYIAAHALEFQSVEEWRGRHQGLLPLEAIRPPSHGPSDEDTDDEDDDVSDNWPEDKLYFAAKQELDVGACGAAIEHYEKLQTRYPFGPYAAQAQLELAYCYYKSVWYSKKLL